MEISDVRYVGKYIALDPKDNVVGVADSKEELIRGLERGATKCPSTQFFTSLPQPG